MTPPSTAGDRRPDGGTRATAKLVVKAHVAHDGDSEALVDHVVAELGALFRRWGVDLLDVDSHAEVITTGDAVSIHLPSVGVVPLDD